MNKFLARTTQVGSAFYGYNYPGGQSGFDTRNGVGKQYGNNVAEKQNFTYNYNVTSMLTVEEAAAGNAQTPTVSKSYGYDGMGNRTSFSDYSTSQITGTSTYNNLNQITQTTVNSPSSPTRVTDYAHDSDGNMTGASTTVSGLISPSSRASYTYDEESRLTSVTNLNGSGQPTSKYEFVYDGLSRLRISRTYARDINNILTLQNETRRVYDGMDVVQELNQYGVVTASYTRTGNIGGILARTTSSGSVFYGYDGGGNVVTLTNSSGAEVGSYTYDAFGNTVAQSGGAANENPYRFSTKEQIGGLYSYGFRFYSPGLGRWINRDPIGEAGGTNLYAFVGNDPVNQADAYGENVLAKIGDAIMKLGTSPAAQRIGPAVTRFFSRGGGQTARSVAQSPAVQSAAQQAPRVISQIGARGLIGVPSQPLEKALSQLRGLGGSGNAACGRIYAFGSRAGSDYRGLPSAKSDLDLLIQRVGPELSKSQNAQFWREVNRIEQDFLKEAGFPLQVHASRFPSQYFYNLGKGNLSEAKNIPLN